MIQLSATEETSLLSAIYPMLLEKGLKALTMDHVARQLGMSKRTLYEIFDNKNDMILRVLNHHQVQTHAEIEEIVCTSPNVMVTLMRISDVHRRDMSRINVNFFRDMDRLYPALRANYEQRHDAVRDFMMKLYDLGVEQGVFRPGINFGILAKMMEIQAESLKRMEELFPPEITLLEIYDTMTNGFLRGIASAKGNELLDALSDEQNQVSSTSC